MKNFSLLLEENSDAKLKVFIEPGSVVLGTQETVYPFGEKHATFVTARTPTGEKIVALVPETIGSTLKAGDTVNEISPRSRDGEWQVNITQK